MLKIEQDLLNIQYSVSNNYDMNPTPFKKVLQSLH